METYPTQGAASSPAGAFRARGTPEVFRVVEILAIEQGRKWGTCSVGYPRFRFWFRIKLRPAKRIPGVHGIKA
jgi:hypothetical protein